MSIIVATWIYCKLWMKETFWPHACTACKSIIIIVNIVQKLQSPNTILLEYFVGEKPLQMSQISRKFELRIDQPLAKFTNVWCSQNILVNTVYTSRFCTPQGCFSKKGSSCSLVWICGLTAQPTNLAWLDRRPPKNTCFFFLYETLSGFTTVVADEGLKEPWSLFFQIPGTSGFTSHPSGCGGHDLLIFSGQSWVNSLENVSATDGTRTLNLPIWSRVLYPPA